jgi:ABC-type multidrug transport system ATPase subunit
LVKDNDNLLVVGNFKRRKPLKLFAYHRDNINGKIWAYFVPEIDKFVIKYIGTSKLILNSYTLNSHCIYRFASGDIIYNEQGVAISFSELKSIAIKRFNNSINLSCNNLSFQYKKSVQGVKPLSFSAYGGEFVAVMGGSGTGKTTLLNLLSGRLTPQSGEVFINNISIDDAEQRESLLQEIGFVPQVDLLNEELSIQQNLMYNTRLCRDDLTPEEQLTKVDALLDKLDLLQLKHLKVGSATEKVISGGQRKRLNISLELIRQPSVLFVDEPTSGLSSNDALQVVSILKQIANSGKIVVINIHQPNSNIFHLFDKLIVMDKEGYPVYVGDPFYAANYFKKHLQLTDTAVEDYMRIGYYNPERIIKLVEYRKTDDSGNQVDKRQFSPKNWHRLLMQQSKGYIRTHKRREKKESNNNQQPNRLKQCYIYFKRNVNSHLADKPYLLFTLLGSPILSMVIGFLLSNSGYNEDANTFINNDNLPVFIYIGVIVSLFFGLINSVGEIHKDRRQLKRESFLRLSISAYLSSKIVYLLITNAYQIGIYVIISNALMGINGLSMKYFIILWLASNAMSMTGLYLSVKLKSILAIYISIPFMLIPQILLAGAVLDFDKINATITDKKYVPYFANMMVSRWTYESIVNILMNDNNYNKNLSELIIRQSSCNYFDNILIPRLKAKIENRTSENSDEIKRMVRAAMFEITSCFPKLPINNAMLDELGDAEIYDLLSKISKYLRKLREAYREELNKRTQASDYLSEDYENISLKDLVLRRNDFVNYTVINGEIIRKYEPAYHISSSRKGRSHLYAPYKRVGDQVFKTWHYNSIMLLAFIFSFAVITLIALKRKYNI